MLGALAVPLLPTPLLAQTPEKVWRVGLLTPPSSTHGSCVS
jgi:hypothetical protein